MQHQTTLTLNEEEFKMFQECKKDGYGYKDIFRIGLEDILEEIAMEQGVEDHFPEAREETND